MIKPTSLSDFQAQAKLNKRVAIIREISCKQLTPPLIYQLISKLYPTDGVIFEDQNHAHICFDPISSISVSNNNKNHPFSSLRALQSELACATQDEAAHLVTHAIGFITYDVIRSFEAIPDRHVANSSLPVLLFHFYRLSLVIDFKKQAILISLIVETNKELLKIYSKAQQKLSDIIALLSTDILDTILLTSTNTVSPIELETSDADFISMVKKAKEAILRGDAFQIVLSRCFKRRYFATPLDIYKTLRSINPAPFMFYFPIESGVIVGASPERLVRVHDRTITVNPIAGTRKKTPDKTNEMISLDLLSDKKEVAEHMMLVDLARNDVGSVSEPNSVTVKEFLQVKHYSHVSHIASTVTGKLQNEYDALDALIAAFPAGTLSGAPKIRAMQLIDELETSRRGLYGGAICRFDLLGNLDSCIAIRTALLQNGIATIRAGAGIVHDSNPANEAQETFYKAQSMLDTIAKADGE